MTDANQLLLVTAASLGFIHTLLGPDHYIPFIAMSKARGWSRGKTLGLTLLCGMGHVLSSVALGFIGLAVGTAVFELESIESARGEIAAGMLICFGFAYFVWGVHRALRGMRHSHAHIHVDGLTHAHGHAHSSGHAHAHESKGNITPWVLFTVFVFGPCEPLIPLVMYPAAGGDMLYVALVAGIFSITTISTMLFMVASFTHVVSRIPFSRFEPWSHAMAGFAIFASGAGVRLLGL